MRMLGDDAPGIKVKQKPAAASTDDVRTEPAAASMSPSGDEKAAGDSEPLDGDPLTEEEERSNEGYADDGQPDVAGAEQLREDGKGEASACNSGNSKTAGAISECDGRPGNAPQV